MKGLREFLGDPYGRLLIAVGLTTWAITFVFCLASGLRPITAFIFANLAVAAVNTGLTIITMAKMR